MEAKSQPRGLSHTPDANGAIQHTSPRCHISWLTAIQISLRLSPSASLASSKFHLSFSFAPLNPSTFSKPALLSFWSLLDYQAQQPGVMAKWYILWRKISYPPAGTDASDKAPWNLVMDSFDWIAGTSMSPKRELFRAGREEPDELCAATWLLK